MNGRQQPFPSGDQCTLRPQNMKIIQIALALSPLSLCSCASIVATTQGPNHHGNLMFAGTKLNASIIGKESCADSRAESHGCAYDRALAPLSVIDFIPSLALDTLLLPFTALHAASQPSPAAAEAGGPAKVKNEVKGD